MECLENKHGEEIHDKGGRFGRVVLKGRWKVEEGKEGKQATNGARPPKGAPGRTLKGQDE